ncbi:MAG: C-terminal processing peptidase-3, partial [Bacteroidetes bacterium]|nr:C-terminal processing peptidase-3 [Bacteroidota bacterium]
MRKYSLFVVLFLTTILYSQGISTVQQRKLGQALSAISGLYVDTISDSKIVESSIRGILKDLDPHSVYIPKDEVQRMREPLEGSFEGIGVQFQILEDTICVVQTIAGAPAEKVGVLPGDKIIFINNELVAGDKIKIQNSDVFKRLRGKKGTEVIVKVKRANNPELIEFKIVRDKIPIYSVDATYMVDKKTGYIKINSFGNTTSDEFTKALDKLKNEGMKDLVLSLQGNGGGFLDAKSTSAGDFEKGRVIVLVDEFSASASEILSGALQDWDRAVIVGVRTFGKGLVQREIPLVDGSMMRLTVARYYTPTGRSIQKPYKDGTETYYKELTNRFTNGELMHADSIHFPDTLKFKTLISGRTVYGG